MCAGGGKVVAFHLLGKKSTQVRYPYPFELRRQDDVATRERILSMTNAEARRAGISKTTLWYMKRDLAQNQRRKLHAKLLERLQGTEACSSSLNSQSTSHK